MTILIVDQNRVRTAQLKEEFGLTPRILIAETALQAVNILDEECPDHIYIGDFITNASLLIDKLREKGIKEVYWMDEVSKPVKNL